MVLCQPGTTVTAKSHATMEWTEIATGMIRAAIRVDAFWYTDHSRAVPRHPMASTV
jgi:hypothetical protein